MSTAELVKLPYKKLERRQASLMRTCKFWRATAKALAWCPKLQRACEIRGFIYDFNARLVETAIVFKNIEDKEHEIA